MDKLIKGLAPPDKEHFEDDDKLVWPNSQMLSNPFIKVAKKKKKKKKKWSTILFYHFHFCEEENLNLIYSLSK